MMVVDLPSHIIIENNVRERMTITEKISTFVTRT